MFSPGSDILKTKGEGNLKVKALAMILSFTIVKKK